MNNWDKLSYLPPKQLREIQNRKLRYFISRQLYPFSPHYRKLFNKNKINPKHIKTVDDLRVIPFTYKEDFLPNRDNPERFRDFILQPNADLIKEYWGGFELLKLSFLKLFKGRRYIAEMMEKEFRPIFLTATTGTTREPISFLYTRHDIDNLFSCGYRLLEVFGVKNGANIRSINLFPYAPHLAFWQTVFGGLSHSVFVLSTGGGKTLGTQGNIDAIRKVKPNILIGVPSYVYHILRSARELGGDFSFLQKIILGASAVSVEFKENLALVLKSMKAKKVRIIGTYGFTEAKRAWGECPTAIKFSSGYHTYPDKDVFEIIDPESGEVKAEGEDGELVYTGIDARGSCVVRYRTGDLVKGGIVYSKCPYCKRTVPRISSSITRAHHIKDLTLSKVKGTLVNLNTFTEILESERNVEEWQIEIRKKENDPFEVDELIVYLSVISGSDRPNLIEKLKNKFHSVTEVTPNDIVILPRKEMLERAEIEVSHKAKRIVDRRGVE